MITAELIIGNAAYSTVGDFCLISHRGNPLTVLSAKVPLAPVDQGAAVTLKYGYASPVEWRGTAINIVKGGDLMVVDAVGTDELALTETLYKESFIDETAEAIVRSALSTTGLAIAEIEAPGIQIARYTADNIPVWQAVHQVEESLRWGHGLTGYALWLGSDGLRWTTGDEPGDIPEIVTGINLIDHAPSDTGLSKVTSFMLPGLTHSRWFRIKDTRRNIEETYRAEMVEHELKDVHARTYIYYRRSA
jgi:hypothetical protein